MCTFSPISGIHEVKTICELTLQRRTVWGYERMHSHLLVFGLALDRVHATGSWPVSLTRPRLRAYLCADNIRCTSLPLTIDVASKKQCSALYAIPNDTSRFFSFGCLVYLYMLQCARILVLLEVRIVLRVTLLNKRATVEADQFLWREIVDASKLGNKLQSSARCTCVT